MKRTHYYKKLEVLPSSKIYLDVDQMQRGRYELQIISRTKVIKTIYFDKK